MANIHMNVFDILKDRELIFINQNILNEISGIMIPHKFILVEASIGFNIITSDPILEHHAQIAFAYMQKFNLDEIKILGGGLVKKHHDNLIQFYERSGDFGFYDYEILKKTLETFDFANNISVNPTDKPCEIKSFTKDEIKNLILEKL